MLGLRLCLVQQEALPATPRKKLSPRRGKCPLRVEIEVVGPSRHRRTRSPPQRVGLGAEVRGPRREPPPRPAEPERRGVMSALPAGGWHTRRGARAHLAARELQRRRKRGGHLLSDGRDRGPEKSAARGGPGSRVRGASPSRPGRPPHPPRAGPELAPRLPPASALRAATSPGAQTSRLHWRPRRAPALLPAPRPS